MSPCSVALVRVVTIFTCHRKGVYAGQYMQLINTRAPGRLVFENMDVFCSLLSSLNTDCCSILEETP